MGTTAEKLAHLKESKNAIKTALETPSNVMRDYAKWIKKYVQNQPTSIVSDGNCTNALDVPVKSIGVDGNSYQGENPSPENPQDIEVIDGVNLFDGGKALDGAISDTNGQLSSVFDSSSTDFIEVNGGDKYYIEPALSSGNWGAWYDSSKNFISGINGYNRAHLAPSNAKYMRCTVNYKGNNTEFADNFIISKGTTPKPYLPHGHIGLQQSGKNFFNAYNINISSIIVSDNGKTITMPIASDGNGGLNTTRKLSELCPNLKVGDIVYLYFDRNLGLSKNGIIYLNGVNIQWNVGSSQTITQEMLDSAVILYGNRYNAGETEQCILTNFRIVKDATDEYEPYHEPKLIPINLNGNSIAKVGDVKDLLKIYRNGDVEIGKNVGKVVLNGSEDWKNISVKNTENCYCYQITIHDFPAQQTSSNIVSNRFQTKLIGWNVLDKDIELLQMYTDRNIYLKINKQLAMDVDTFKLWLSQYLTEVYYQLATPQTIKLPSIEPIELWEGTNKFELITNLDTTFEMEYVVNKDYLETQNLLNIVEGENI